MMTRLIPKIFYDRMADGLDLFVGCLGFRVLYRDAELAVVERDGAKAYLVESAEFAAKDRPEITKSRPISSTTSMRELHVARPEMLHPNARTVELKPWGAREFAVRDATGVCVLFRQW